MWGKFPPHIFSMNRYDALLGRKRSPKSVSKSYSYAVRSPKTNIDVVYEGTHIESHGPKSQLFHLRGPNGYTASIPMRHLRYGVEALPYGTNKLTIELPSGVTEKLFGNKWTDTK